MISINHITDTSLIKYYISVDGWHEKDAIVAALDAEYGPRKRTTNDITQDGEWAVTPSRTRPSQFSIAVTTAEQAIIAQDAYDSVSAN